MGPGVRREELVVDAVQHEVLVCVETCSFDIMSVATNMIFFFIEYHNFFGNESKSIKDENLKFRDLKNYFGMVL